MFCDRCAREGTVARLFQMTPQGKRDLFLCPNCVEELAGKMHLIPFDALAAWVASTLRKEEQEELFRQKCPRCGRTLEEFLITPFRGCPCCYHEFSPLLLSLTDPETLGRISTATKEPKASKGKKQAVELPASRKVTLDPELKLLILKERLEALIRDERYEEAQELSAEIRKIKSG